MSVARSVVMPALSLSVRVSNPARPLPSAACGPMADAVRGAGRDEEEIASRAASISLEIRKLVDERLSKFTSHPTNAETLSPFGPYHLACCFVGVSFPFAAKVISTLSDRGTTLDMLSRALADFTELAMEHTEISKDDPSIVPFFTFQTTHDRLAQDMCGRISTQRQAAAQLLFAMFHYAYSKRAFEL